MRDLILQTKGNTTLYVNEEQAESDLPLYKSFGERLPTGKLKTTSSQYGLALKTYNSDLLQNWINTEWIDGVTGINEISGQYKYRNCKQRCGTNRTGKHIR